MSTLMMIGCAGIYDLFPGLPLVGLGLLAMQDTIEYTAMQWIDKARGSGWHSISAFFVIATPPAISSRKSYSYRELLDKPLAHEWMFSLIPFSLPVKLY